MIKPKVDPLKFKEQMFTVLRLALGEEAYQRCALVDNVNNGKDADRQMHFYGEGLRFAVNVDGYKTGAYFTVEITGIGVEVSPGEWVERYMSGLNHPDKRTPSGKKTVRDYSRHDPSWQVRIPWSAAPVDAGIALRMFLNQQQADVNRQNLIAAVSKRVHDARDQENRCRTVVDTLGLTKIRDNYYSTPLPRFFVRTDDEDKSKVRLEFGGTDIPVEKLVDLMGDLADFSMALERALTEGT